jgi:hypothetical protein
MIRATAQSFTHYLLMIVLLILKGRQRLGIQNASNAKYCLFVDL